MAAREKYGLIPQLVVNGAAKAIEFYKTVLGAVEVSRTPAPDSDRLMHSELESTQTRRYGFNYHTPGRERLRCNGCPCGSSGSHCDHATDGHVLGRSLCSDQGSIWPRLVVRTSFKEVVLFSILCLEIDKG
jgi:catechol 2,3-dioxygenase-like lactoylglutathione lyase family enzyme